MGGLKLYDYAASGNCYKVRLLLAHLGRAYERVPVDIFGGDTLTDEYAAKNPARATPLLELDDGRFLSESNAILTYLARGTEYLPDDPYELADVVRWLIFEQTDVMMTMGGLRFRLLTGRLAPDDPEAIRRREGAEEALAFLQQHLVARDFLAAGRYTIADIAVFAYGHVAAEAGLELDPFPAFTAWIARVERQPGFMNDLAPYPDNARPGAGRSVYG
ncbi:MAG TPA: glutathione S-transferase family protein [Gaiellaceae bacterium]|nr:glutathione S-transferase family protein [Gaiellaceae bacterium]